MSKVAYYSAGVFLLAWAGLAMSATIYVPANYATIQAAIDAAVSGDEIEVAPGIYYELISFNGKGVRLYSSAGSVVTTLNGGGDGPVVTCNNGEAASTILDGFTITGSSADAYAMYNRYGSPTVNDCTFIANGGGGMSNVYSSPTVNDCTFSDNIARSGGGMLNVYSNPTVVNCMFNGNRSTPMAGHGGGMVNVHSSNPTVTNCTFSNNTASSGGGMYNTSYSTPTVTNCIFWRDLPDEISGSATVTYCDVEGSLLGEGNIDTDPLFVGGGDYHLILGSPCIDAGNNSVVTVPTDLDGSPRIQGVAVDMGAYETTGSPKDVLDRTIGIVAGLDPGSLTNPNTGDTLVNKLQATIALIEAGLYWDALMKLQHDILPKMDGCALRGQPDKDDWITTCEGQQQVYPLVLQAIQLLQSP